MVQTAEVILPTEKKIDSRYVLVTLLATLFTWEVHELAHWLTGELLGNDMVMTLNTGYPEAGQYKHERNAILIDAAGPFITVLQAVVVYMLIKKGRSLNLLPLLLAPFYMRTLAAFFNLINLNDEGRISKALGIGTFTLPIIVALVLFYMVYDAMKARRLPLRIIFVSLLIILVTSSILILSDQIFKIKLL
jgi:hypothetical protein